LVAAKADISDSHTFVVAEASTAAIALATKKENRQCFQRYDGLYCVLGVRTLLFLCSVPKARIPD